MKKAFTLVEIMIVVAIVIGLITIATPNLLRSRVVANEGAAVGNLRAVNNGAQLYHINRETYPASLSAMAEPNSNPPYIDAHLASGRKQSYEFNYSLVDSDHFTVNANPTAMGLLKGKYFYMDESGIIRFNASAPAGPGDETVK
ncbi:MAG: prepilin-type N-terminal cleavage/methylation domain-containing protein [Candidatus Omnitrophota bacterium]